MQVIFFTCDQELSKMTAGINGSYLTIDELDVDKLSAKGETLLFYHWDSFKEDAKKIFDKLRQISKIKIVLMSDEWDVRRFVEHQSEEKNADGYIKGPWNLKTITGVIDDFSLSIKSNEIQDDMDDLTYVGVTKITNIPKGLKK